MKFKLGLVVLGSLVVLGVIGLGLLSSQKQELNQKNTAMSSKIIAVQKSMKDLRSSNTNLANATTIFQSQQVDILKSNAREACTQFFATIFNYSTDNLNLTSRENSALKVATSDVMASEFKGEAAVDNKTAGWSSSSVTGDLQIAIQSTDSSTAQILVGVPVTFVYPNSTPQTIVRNYVVTFDFVQLKIIGLTQYTNGSIFQ
jgi:hypothetical protein